MDEERRYRNGRNEVRNAHTPATNAPEGGSFVSIINITLRCYSIFVQKVRAGLELKTAIRQAITYCETHDILADYFQKNESEVFDMVNFKWDQKRALEIAKEDGFADGIAVGEARGEARGERKATMKIALSLLKKDLPVGVITDSTNLSLEEIRKIAKDNGLAF